MRLSTSRARRRVLTSLTVADVMIRVPKVVTTQATIGDLRSFFDDEHVHMALIVEDGVLRGTVVRADVPLALGEETPALAVSRLHGRVVAAHTSAEAARRGMIECGERRLAVVDTDGRLEGLLCLKRRLSGFCSDTDVNERSHTRWETSS